MARWRVVREFDLTDPRCGFIVVRAAGDPPAKTYLHWDEIPLDEWKRMWPADQVFPCAN